MLYKNFQRGVSLVEVLLVTALIVVFFTGILGAFRGIFILVADTSARQTAMTLASDVMEEIRSLQYDSVGTIGGIPPGPLPQVSTTTRNGVVFTISILVEYIDDPADGLGTSDINGITTDYKKSEVTVEWSVRERAQRASFSSIFVPPGIESDVGGGTLRVNVFDASIEPVAGATVRLRNSSLDPVIDTTRITNASGVALFSGAPTGSGYEIEVNKAGFSSDQTHAVSGTLTNPLMPPVTIVEGNITSTSFSIDETSTLAIKTLFDQVTNSVSLITTDDSDTIGYSGISFSTNGVQLEEVSGAYGNAGSAKFVSVMPATLQQWQFVEITSLVPSATAWTVKVYDGNNPSVIIPNSVLSGNETGFSQAVIDISAIDPALYPSLSLEFLLETIDTSTTTSISEIEISYIESDTPAPDVNLSLMGNKIIGTNSSGVGVLKNNSLVQTNELGDLTVTDLEWDLYDIFATGYAIVEACPRAPISINPATANVLRLVLESAITTSLRVHVVDANGIPINGAAVEVSRSGYADTAISQSCGQVFFNSIPSATGYEVSVSATGYVSEVITGIGISSNEVLLVELTAF